MEGAVPVRALARGEEPAEMPLGAEVKGLLSRVDSAGEVTGLEEGTALVGRVESVGVAMVR